MTAGTGGGVILVTGATGFLGTQVVSRLLARPEGEVFVLVRAATDEQATRRLARAWWDWPDLVTHLGTRLHLVRGDVCEAHLGLDDATYAALVRRLTHVIHTAADLRLDGPLEEMRRANVLGTANVLALAEEAHADHGLSRFAHVSTAYVAGRRRGTVSEESLSDEAGFSNSYERTKFEAERLVRHAAGRLPVSIFRPGMIVGDSRTGAIRTFNTLYFPLRLYLGGRLRLVPAATGLKVNMVPVDYVAGAIADLTLASEAEGLTFHLTAPAESLPTAGQLVEFVRHWARERLGLSLPKPVLVPLPQWLLGGKSSVGAGDPSLSPSPTRRSKSGLVARLRQLAPYFAEQRRFCCDNAERLYPYRLDWRQFLPPIMEYAVRCGFLHRSERTVHKQALFRLGSKSRPVRYFDIVDGKAVCRSAAEVRGDILAAAAALRRLGIGAGDRVGIVGLNSSRYLALDVAIGLVGAVSVPLYYTSPPAELDQILSASGARL
ncbi:MAG: SDR family oxidoreductase, partial [Anaerolineae bacterium]